MSVSTNINKYSSIMDQFVFFLCRVMNDVATSKIHKSTNKLKCQHTLDFKGITFSFCHAGETHVCIMLHKLQNHPGPKRQLRIAPLNFTRV